ncbi:MAG: AbrB/MazE/SpoVT family DNA-binding domain-containing protein [Candidatus Eremiobacteraeota bacterium]|nr:AbrB/MazE/SpoVT family DNA-binding domain-containing protein [Candidatus Eremiobacteraeota bacterium]
MISEKGQVTIPKRLRTSLGLTAGAQIEFQEKDGKLIGSRVQQTDPLATLLGLLPRMNVKEALQDLRGPEWRSDLDKGNRGNRSR